MSYTLKDLELHSERNAENIIICALKPASKAELLLMLDVLREESEGKAEQNSLIWLEFSDRLWSASIHQPAELPFRVRLLVNGERWGFNVDEVWMDHWLSFNKAA